MRTAVIIGSTGLVGRALVDRLVQANSWSEIIVISRKDAEFSSSKVRRIQFDFINWGELELQIKSFAGSTPIHFFCCLGTTMSKAGSKENFRLVDFQYVIQFAKLYQRCEGTSLAIVSALGADANSKVFYNQVKGEMENEVRKLNVKNVYFFRPSLLVGDREEFRFFERTFVLFTPLLEKILFGSLKKYRPVPASTVARAMVNISFGKKPSTDTIENAEIFDFGI